ncbi:hypothetical protein PHYBLDRAFT_58377 [Phycomyces blakesleeanus NRRL 1555(-)]|uniref:Uncharacterized protein n=1 Tax=Phycomyces blakesleeanus (strain ATCC 8743b / DSM 1359 / FGSC 10004 / NBRC 33097 / NRRL 1555) TaxID=763407 RepID=A0A167Q9P0_PHYB8|nr:hypothetical protein PHYBLDRAFT_58377 [Phycomyces blakesleeanus NRRL 1555(-)]OAD79328.1 hypothetical protein PHYBLDRAFT_58377 [Phycomyces blakesleeanus NRRL 1555(-)]|eukprot:XP_018297368.1 hypothetical protein PHYBLDRAFT_58377 [Phycomyces blakesleeanus NRRL 1555(-)]
MVPNKSNRTTRRNRKNLVIHQYILSSPSTKDQEDEKFVPMSSLSGSLGSLTYYKKTSTTVKARYSDMDGGQKLYHYHYIECVFSYSANYLVIFLMLFTKINSELDIVERLYFLVDGKVLAEIEAYLPENKTKNTTTRK